MAESWDSSTRETVKKIPLLTVNAGPRDKEKWPERLKQVRAEHRCLRAAVWRELFERRRRSCTPALGDSVSRSPAQPEQPLALSR